MSGPFRNSLARWNRSWPLRFAMGGVLLLPLIFGGLMVWSNWNPQGNAGNLPAAIVNEDQAVEADGHTIEAGQNLTDAVLAEQQLNWTVTDSSDAEDGLNSGRYYLVLKIPSGFSAEIATIDSDTPTQANLEVITNDATNYLVGALAEDSVKAIEGQATQTLQFEFLDHVYSAIGTLEENEGEVLNGADKLAKNARKAADGGQAVASGATDVAAGNKQVAEKSQKIADNAGEVPAAAQKIADTADKVATDAQAIETNASSVDQQLADVEAKLTAAGETALAQEVADARSDLDSGVVQPAKDLATETKAAAEKANEAAASSQQVVTDAENAAKKLSELSKDASAVSSDATKLASSLSDQLAPEAEELSSQLSRAAAKIPPTTEEQKKAFSQVLSKPINVQDTRWNPVGFLGDGLAPYFLAIALYVGAMFLLLLIPALNPRIMNLGKPVKAALQSYAPLVFYGAIGTIVMLTGVIALVGVRASAFLPLLLVSLVAMACFTAIVQFLRASMGTVGAYTALVLLVLQMTSAAGVFPIETVGRFFQFLHPVLPMTYAVDGIRRAIAGGPMWPYLGTDTLVLVAITLICLAGTTYIAKRRKLVVSDAPAMEVHSQ